MSGEHSRNLRDGSITLKDGTTPTPFELIIPLQEGDLSFTENHPHITIKNRGRLDHRREGDEEEVDISFSCKFVQYSYNSGSSGSPSGTPSVIDFLRKQGAASAYKSTDEACAPYAVDLIFNINDPCNSPSKEILTFSKFIANQIQFREGADASMLSITGKAFVTKPTRTYA